MDRLKERIAHFEELFGKAPTALVYAPSRINLIGEHLDYNGGHVLPCAIELGTYALIAPSESFDFVSLNMEERVRAKVEDLATLPPKGWGAYPLGVGKRLEELGTPVKGFCGLFWGEIPTGAGLSSSASLEVLTATIFAHLGGFDLDPLEKAHIGRWVENVHLGLNSGIMDQFAIAMGQKDTAFFLETVHETYEPIPLDLQGHALVVMYTGVSRQLVEGAYNDRFNACQELLAQLREPFGINALCELPLERLEEAMNLVEDATLRRRLRHVITEESRVKEAVEALQGGDLLRFGHLLDGSHASLSEDYEVSSRELDMITELARRHGGCLGARMTGAGFAGCVIALVREDRLEDFLARIPLAYEKMSGHTPTFFVTKASHGPTTTPLS